MIVYDNDPADDGRGACDVVNHFRRIASCGRVPVQVYWLRPGAPDESPAPGLSEVLLTGRTLDLARLKASNAALRPFGVTLIDVSRFAHGRPLVNIVDPARGY
jgi:hypothetical protein